MALGKSQTIVKQSMPWVHAVLAVEHELEKQSWEGETNDEDGVPKETTAMWAQRGPCKDADGNSIPAAGRKPVIPP